MGEVLGSVYRTLSTQSIKKAGYTKASAQTGSVTLIKRFGSALNLAQPIPRRFCAEQQNRVQEMPANRGKTPDSTLPDTDWCDKSPAEHHRAKTWMQRLKRVFNIDI